jgi:hypothetical protein
VYHKVLSSRLSSSHSIHLTLADYFRVKLLLPLRISTTWKGCASLVESRYEGKGPQAVTFLLAGGEARQVAEHKIPRVGNRLESVQKKKKKKKV